MNEEPQYPEKKLYILKGIGAIAALAGIYVVSRGSANHHTDPMLILIAAAMIVAGLAIIAWE